MTQQRQDDVQQTQQQMQQCGHSRPQAGAGDATKLSSSEGKPWNEMSPAEQAEELSNVVGLGTD